MSGWPVLILGAAWVAPEPHNTHSEPRPLGSGLAPQPLPNSRGSEGASAPQPLPDGRGFERGRGIWNIEGLPC